MQEISVIIVLLLTEQKLHKYFPLKKKNIEQCDDTLDTWFLSSLWPFATLGWPDKTPDYNKFYPAQLIETADDILFFWCARMLMMGKLCTKQYPFKDIYLHGIIRDSKGKKMSKGLGNGIDPLTIIDKYGTDALRWALASHTTAGQDMKLSEEQFNASKKFMNKIWQAGRFFHQHATRLEIEYEATQNSYLSNFKETYNEHLNNYDFLQASTKLQHKFKHEFCDIWIEKNKKAIFNNDIDKIKEGISIYLDFLKLFSPFIPFITYKLDSFFSN
jgi:valyl-tRNA synthetase